MSATATASAGFITLARRDGTGCWWRTSAPSGRRTPVPSPRCVGYSKIAIPAAATPAGARPARAYQVPVHSPQLGRRQPAGDRERKRGRGRGNLRNGGRSNPRPSGGGGRSATATAAGGGSKRRPLHSRYARRGRGPVTKDSAGPNRADLPETCRRPRGRHSLPVSAAVFLKGLEHHGW